MKGKFLRTALQRKFMIRKATIYFNGSKKNLEGTAPQKNIRNNKKTNLF